MSLKSYFSTSDCLCAEEAEMPLDHPMGFLSRLTQSPCGTLHKTSLEPSKMSEAFRSMKPGASPEGKQSFKIFKQSAQAVC